MKKNLFDLLEAGIPAMSTDAEGQLRGGFTALMGGMGALSDANNTNCNCNCDNCNCMDCDCDTNENCNCNCKNCKCTTKPPLSTTPTPKPSTELACGLLPGLGNTLLF